MTKYNTNGHKSVKSGTSDTILDLSSHKTFAWDGYTFVVMWLVYSIDLKRDYNVLHLNCYMLH